MRISNSSQHRDAHDDGSAISPPIALWPAGRSVT